MKQNWVLAPLFGALAVVACSGAGGTDDAVDEANVDQSGESSDELRRRKRDAGTSSTADARVPDARVPDARVPDARPTPTASDDPFEPGSCLGPSLTSAKVLAQFGPYVDSIAVGKYESFLARGLVLGKKAHLVVRVAQEGATKVNVRIDGANAGTIALERTGAWEEKPFELPSGLVTDRMRVELTNDGPGDFVDYHAWILQ